MCGARSGTPRARTNSWVLSGSAPVMTTASPCNDWWCWPLEGLDDDGRHAGGEDAGGDVAGDHAARPDHGTGADGDSFEHGDAGSHPDPVADDDRLRAAVTVAAPGVVVVAVHDDRVLTDQAAVADADQRVRRDRAPVVEEDAVADLEAASAVRVQVAADGVAVHEQALTDHDRAVVHDPAPAEEPRPAAHPLARAQAEPGMRHRQRLPRGGRGVARHPP